MVWQSYIIVYMISTLQNCIHIVDHQSVGFDWNWGYEGVLANSWSTSMEYRGEIWKLINVMIPVLRRFTECTQDHVHWKIHGQVIVPFTWKSDDRLWNWRHYYGKFVHDHWICLAVSSVGKIIISDQSNGGVEENLCFFSKILAQFFEILSWFFCQVAVQDTFNEREGVPSVLEQEEQQRIARTPVVNPSPSDQRFIFNFWHSSLQFVHLAFKFPAGHEKPSP